MLSVIMLIVMLNVANNSFMLSVIVLSVVVLSVVVLSVVVLSVVASFSQYFIFFRTYDEWAKKLDCSFPAGFFSLV
jgi:hypothetical protein